MTTAADQAVDRGFELLTRVVGQQRLSEIRPDLLDVGDTELCVLAVLYGDYRSGRELLGLDREDAITYGFQCGATDAESCHCDELTDAWRRRIRRLRRSPTIV